MSVSFSNPSGKTFRRNFSDRPTKHSAQEFLPGDRYAPWIQIRYREGANRVAPYLPFLYIKKDFLTYTVIPAHKIVSMDEQGYMVPANAILPVQDGTDFYEGRPLVYAERDYAGAAGQFGDWPDTDGPVNLNVFDGQPLEAADVNTEKVVSGAAGTAGDDAGKAGRTFASVAAARMPMGFITDEALEGASRFSFNEMDPQEALTMITCYTLAIAEKSIMRRNYGQATREAILLRNSLVGRAATDLALGEVGTGTGATELAGLPYWANQGDPSNANATGYDIITPGDLVACNDQGDPIRFDVRVDDWNIAAMAGDPTDVEMNGRYPVAAVAAIVGRCHAREEVVSSTPLAKVKTYQDAVLGGSGTGGIETYLTRGDAMSAGEVTGLIAARKPLAGAPDAYVSRDASAAKKYALLVHLSLL